MSTHFSQTKGPTIKCREQWQDAPPPSRSTAFLKLIGLKTVIIAILPDFSSNSERKTTSLASGSTNPVPVHETPPKRAYFRNVFGTGETKNPPFPKADFFPCFPEPWRRRMQATGFKDGRLPYKYSTEKPHPPAEQPQEHYTRWLWNYHNTKPNPTALQRAG